MAVNKMQSPNPPDVWHLMFEQTPVIIRGLLGFVTLGLFTVAGILYRWHRKDMQRIEDRMNKIEERMEQGFTEMRGYLIANIRK